MRYHTKMIDAGGLGIVEVEYTYLSGYQGSRDEEVHTGELEITDVKLNGEEITLWLSDWAFKQLEIEIRAQMSIDEKYAGEPA